jgi:hypothetical protein
VLILYPLLVIAAATIAWKRRHLPGGRGASWFLAWAAGGFLLGFSLVTGLSIGLFIAPAAAVVLLWVATSSPHLREASGFLLGLVGVAVLLVIVNP